jgi:integrase
MAELLSPALELSWLSEIEKDLALEAHPKPRFDRIVTSEQLVEAGLLLVREARDAHRRRPIWRAAQMRDGLMMALLALCPIRIKNFSRLRLQETFRREGGGWWIVLSGRDTKSGRPDERPVPAMLNEAIGLYLTWARPRLLAAGELMVGAEIPTGDDLLLSGALWAGEKGEALSLRGVERALKEATRKTMGVGLSPHDFRRCAATTAAFYGGDRPYLASALLQHTDSRVTDEHYNRASSMGAALHLGALVERLRGRCSQRPITVQRLLITNKVPSFRTELDGAGLRGKLSPPHRQPTWTE